ncbi:MAG: transposase [Prevotella sp.]|jgi:REP element-mobilizing transposase RayT|nr:transposase [Prevotella sp.]
MISIQNRITDEIYFTTTTVVDWVDIFTRPRYKHIIIDSLQYCQQNKGLIIYAWVLMSNHLHLIAGANGANTLSDILRDFKKYTSKGLLRMLETDIQEPRRDWILNRFEYAAQNDKKIKNYHFWQDGNDMQPVYMYDYLIQKLNYIHQNPVTAEIVNQPEDYRYSSAGDYAGVQGLLDVIVI